MNNQDKNALWEKIGHAIGYVMATTVVGCFIALLVAITIKAIMFIL